MLRQVLNMKKLGFIAVTLAFTVVWVVSPSLRAAASAGRGATGLGSPTGTTRHGSKTDPAPVKKAYPTFGQVDRVAPELDRLIPAGARLEKLAGGFVWTEGPLWNPRARTLLFSDIPRNVIFEWKEGLGTRDFLYPSGYTGAAPRGGEVGANALTFDAQGRLVFCAQGDRSLVRLDAEGRRTTIADYYLDRRFNSPNDLVYKSNGDLYFTDPPYGLEGHNDDPKKELLFNGVYLLRASGRVVLLTRDLTFPNGLAFSPDEKTLYLSVSDPKRPVIMAYGVRSDGTLGPGRVFFDATALAAKGLPGLPDGMKVDVKGNLFATGPGGVLVLTPQGELLGTINTGETTANCAWGGDDGSTLYITAHTYLCRIKTSTKGHLP